MFFNDRSSLAKEKRISQAGKAGISIAHEEKTGEPLQSVLSLYCDNPSGELSLEEFEHSAIQRLKVLKEIEQEKARNTKFEAYTNKIRECERCNLSTKPDPSDSSKTKPIGMKERIRLDQLSHYALRLAYCKTDDQRRWFVTHETALFRHRFECEKSDRTRRSFLEQQGIRVQIINKDEMPDAVREGIEEMEKSMFFKDINGVTKQGTGNPAYLKVPFEEVLDSVKRRKAFLNAGDAYVPYSELLTFVEPRFKMALSATLTRSSKVIHLVERDQRLVALLAFLREQYLAFGNLSQEATGVTGTLNLSNLEAASKQAFPPCMLQMKDRMKSHHHLKWEGRKQLGAFLKRAGLTMEDSMVWWKSSFTGSHVTPEKFDKEYSYALRYLYGKEGNGHGYKPYTCMRLIMGEPANEKIGVVHGCPFKILTEDQLTLMLRKLGVTDAPLRETVELAKGEHFQLACQKSFHGRYKVEDDGDVVTHPNDYYDKAMALLEDKAEGSDGSNSQQQSQTSQMLEQKNCEPRGQKRDVGQVSGALAAMITGQ